MLGFYMRSLHIYNFDCDHMNRNVVTCFYNIAFGSTYRLLVSGHREDGQYVTHGGEPLPWQEFDSVTSQLTEEQDCVVIRGDVHNGLQTVSCDLPQFFICERNRKLTFNL